MLDVVRSQIRNVGLLVTKNREMVHKLTKEYVKTPIIRGIFIELIASP
jgi:hypothetical protein